MIATDADYTIDRTIPEFTDEEYHAQWRELEKQFPAPTWEEMKEEFFWVHDRVADGTFDPEFKFRGLAVAFHQRKVIGADINWLRLTVAMSRKFGIHPDRIIVKGFPDFE